MEELHGFIKVDFGDHVFAKFMRDNDPNWTWEHVAEYTRFIAHGKIIALVKYKNDYPVNRWIWIKKDMVVGNIHDSLIIQHKNGKKVKYIEGHYGN